MKIKLNFLLLLVTTCFATVSFAADDIAFYPIKQAMNPALFQKANVGNQISFYFGKQKHAKILTRFGVVQGNSRTRKFGRSQMGACNWVFLSALKELRNHARKLGGNAVINIQSNWKHATYSSQTHFQCAAGFLVAGVTLKGEVVKLAKP